MSEPQTWLLLGNMEACLRRITKADGFYTDVGQFITREPHQIPESQDALVALMLDTQDPANQPALVRTHQLQTVVVVPKVGVGRSDAQLCLHRLISDVQKAFARQQSKFPDGTQFPRFVSARPLLPSDGMKWVGAEMRYAAHVPLDQP